MVQQILIPRLLGVRSSAQAIAALLKPEVTEVELVFTDNQVTSQGACDELVRSIAELRRIKMLVVAAGPLEARYLRESAERRNVNSLVFFDL